MRFGHWYPLATAGDHTPNGENVLQLRIAAGLIDYPRGKSAMVHYEHATDARARALSLAQEHAARDLLCRHLIEIDQDLGGFAAKLARDFETRFGELPRVS